MNETITEVSKDQNRQDMALIAARAAVVTLKTDAALIMSGRWGRNGRKDNLPGRTFLTVLLWNGNQRALRDRAASM